MASKLQPLRVCDTEAFAGKYNAHERGNIAKCWIPTHEVSELIPEVRI